MNIFADNRIISVYKVNHVFDKVENVVEKGENAGYQHFLHFPQRFPKTSVLGEREILDCVLKNLPHSHTTTPFEAPGKQAF